MKLGLRIVILTGAKTQSVRVRYEGLGVEDIYVGCAVKVETYEAFLKKYGFTDEEIMYMGDDIPDLEIMRRMPQRCLYRNQASKPLCQRPYRRTWLRARCHRTDPPRTRQMDHG